ncbi:TRAP transporter 4TM/12TM fusion protein [Stella humosa]|uniref:TRAP transporter 4TM/12TM fusion protein n=1 Tax=Stella humosa TaxID=94 RepID=A0A3N1MF44_9PROT|nr:TRAP transporter fused permease subunit [Stella humosa]ROQ01350.1 TRAP transporter 4TM/12TM fusion protein [Stella humosa]BBK31724.1 C4-dicarboxylate ABC transporter [Stella humosa]
MRDLKGKTGLAIACWAVIASLFQMYTAGFGFFEPREQRSIHLLLLMPLAFLLFPARPGKSPEDHPSLADWGLAFLCLLPNVYSYVQANRINLRFENVDPLLPGELAMGLLATLLILEALRRAVTPILAGLVAVGIAYLFVTEYAPGMLNYRDMATSEIIETMYLLNGMGIYGSITGISSTMVAIFIVFGAFIEHSGVGRLFHNLGTKVAGGHSGGPAKVEVISSALFGTISGSSTANVYATGSFTIPAMMRLGYRPHFAAGVEASSSVGGQIMPPVMGAGAFVMAEITGIPYSDIILAALLGSVCYFFMILVSVHFEAKRLGLVGCDPADIPLWKVIVDDLHLLIPVFLLIGLLMVDYSPHFSAFWSILAVVGASWIRRHTRIYPATLWRMLVTGGRNMTIVGLACAGAGMFVACLTVTGLVISISTVITSLSGGNLLIAGALLMVTTIILGMGVPTTAAYIIGASIGAKLLIDLGVPMLQAHLFVFYFSILADATPPVSVASYAAASIARCDPIKTGLVAFRLAIAGFVVGFSYLYTPALLMQGPVEGIVSQMLLVLGGLTLAAAGFFGFFRQHVAVLPRIVLGAGGIIIVLAEEYSDWYRVVIIAVVMALLYYLPGVFAPARPPINALAAGPKE